MAQAATNFQVVLDNLMPQLVHPSKMIYHSIVDTIYAKGHWIATDAFIGHPK